jgi:heat shock protein HslJ
MPAVLAALPVWAILASAAVAQANAQSFPYGRELRLDADPMRGSRRVPILDIGDNGTAVIDLWCNSVQAQLIVVAATITIIAGPRSPRQCTPDLARADDDLLAALSEVTTWRMDNSALVLSGGRMLRFVVQTN